jgi:hypothetical protein
MAVECDRSAGHQKAFNRKEREGYAKNAKQESLAGALCGNKLAGSALITNVPLLNPLHH